MKKFFNLVLVFAISILSMSLLSCLFAAAAYFMGKNVLGWFFTSFGCITIIGMFWNMYLQYKNNLISRAIKTRVKLADSYQTISISCAYCSVANIVKIILGTDNEFTCQNCNNLNKIYIDVTTARATKPLIADSDMDSIFKKLNGEKNSTQTRQNTINSQSQSNITIK